MQSDFAAFFGADYPYFYEPVQLPERAEREADLLVRLLDISSGARILDAACGYGRIAIRLAQRGFSVVGVDVSRPVLARARRVAADLGVQDGVELRAQDLRLFREKEAFDAAICWFTSFGLFDDEDDRQILRNLAQSLKPGGHLALEVLKRDALAESLRTDRSLPVLTSEVGDDAIIDRMRLSPDGSHLEVRRVTMRDGRATQARLNVRAFVRDEIFGWLADAGFRDAKEYSITDEDRSLFTRWSMVVVAKR